MTKECNIQDIPARLPSPAYNYQLFHLDIRKVDERLNIVLTRTVCTNSVPIMTTPPLCMYRDSDVCSPNWRERYIKTVESLARFKIIKIEENTSEFNTISDMVHPANITSIEQIVNPILWSRFVNKRKDMIASKRVPKCAYSNLDSIPYNENMALLFSCPNDAVDINDIFLNGTNAINGNGRAIFFNDNSWNSQYKYFGQEFFIIFGVLLGDSLNVPDTSLNFNEPPQKYPNQQRNSNDLHFDSVIGHLYQNNEYIIYSSDQCVPLYIISYSKGADFSAKPGNKIYSSWSEIFPPIGWRTHTHLLQDAWPDISNTQEWAFDAKLIFSKIGYERNNVIKSYETTHSVGDIVEYFKNWKLYDQDQILEFLARFDYDICNTLHCLILRSKIPSLNSGG